MSQTHELKRSITLPFLVLYGLGTMIGGGFYALLGKVSGDAGLYAPIALVMSGLFALITGLSFSELVSRFPDSAGEVRYVNVGFNNAFLAKITGGLVILTGTVSAATLTVATVGFLQDMVQVPKIPAVVLLVLLMGAIAAWGIGKSVAVVAVITVIEVGALIYAATVAEGELVHLVDKWRDFVPPLSVSVWTGIFSGAFLAFYAFIGFEDMVNMAEEVKDARNAVPAAIIISVVITVALYFVVSLIALLSVSPEQLAMSNTPIAEIVRARGWYSSTGIWLVSLLTGLNGALVQIIMGSRVAYGMAKRKQAPKWLSKVHPKTQTPIRATVLIMAVVLVLALYFPLTTLAKTTSGIILVIFAVVNLALWRIKRRYPDMKGQKFQVPIWLPLIGGLSCLLVLALQITLLVTSS